MKKIYFLLSLFSFSIFANEYKNYPFDWTNHFGVASHNGRVIWNNDWMYGILFFDGTFSNYPLRYGFDIDENFSLFYNSYFPNQEAEFDTNFVDTHLLYTQGDYYLDRLFIKTRYADKSRLLTFNGHKKTFTGPYADYSLGIIQPIQQSYYIEYKTNKLQAAIGNFITSSGLPDSSLNGSLNDRILNASILSNGINGDWEWTFYASQYNQKYVVKHSSWYHASSQYLTRSMIQGKIINEIKDSFFIGIGFNGNFRGLSDINSFSSKKWGSIYSTLSMKNLSFESGFFSMNNDYNTFISGLFHIERMNKGVSIEVSRRIKPSYYFITGNDIVSGFESTESMEFLSWYSFSKITLMTKFYSQNIFDSKNKYEIIGGDLNIKFNFIQNWILSGNIRHLVNPSIITDGVGDYLELNISGKENLFNNNMILFIDLGLVGWINRDANISFNPYYCKPIIITDPNFILQDQWILNSSVSLKVSSLKVTWKMNNIFEALRPLINNFPDSQSKIINNYFMHINDRNMGRLLEINIEWYFSD